MDVVVVGGGVAGLTCAARLAVAGASVVLVERRKLGSGATLSNHGIIHSGALYALKYPGVAQLCHEALPAWQASCPSAGLSIPASWYVAEQQAVAAIARKCHELGVTAHVISQRRSAEQLGTSPAALDRAIAVQDHIVSSYLLVLWLAQTCLEAGVTFRLGASVEGLRVRPGGYDVQLAGREAIAAEAVVLCAGLGLISLAQQLRLSTLPQLHSRLSVMVATPNRGLQQPIFHVTPGGAMLVPNAAGTALLSQYGAPQRPIAEPGRRLIPLAAVTGTIQAAKASVKQELLSLDDGWAYVCTKTELSTSPRRPEAINPQYAVIDHTGDGLPGVWTIVPGKMTLALHASREVATRMGLKAPELSLPASRVDAATGQLVAAPPWRGNTAITANLAQAG